MKYVSLVPLLCITLVLLPATALALDQGDATTYFGDDSTADKQTYLDWFSNAGQKYSRSLFLETSLSTGEAPHGAALFWTANDTHIHLGVAARALGWASFGLSENGGMRGADMVIFTGGAEDEQYKLTDTYVLQELYPIEDDCQNWELVHGSIADGFVIFEAVRELYTGDLQDRKMRDDSDLAMVATTVIMAWGDSASYSYHGKNRLRNSLRFFGNSSNTEQQLFETALAEAEGVVELRANNFSIPMNETRYKSFCWDTNDLIALGIPVNESLHTIGIEAIVSEATREYVHHFILSANTAQSGWIRDPENEPFSCRGFNGQEVVYGWAPGEAPLTFPLDVGSPLGKDGFQAFKLEIHYNNPELANITYLDASGVRLLWTSKKRQYDAGLFAIGDVITLLKGTPVGDGLASASFDCPSSCSDIGLADGPVLVTRENLHMHKSGVRMSNEVRRNGEVVHEAHVDFYDFEQSGTLAPQQEAYQVFAGDTFHPKCFYQNDHGANMTFGLSSQEEMCIVFIYYYPRKTINNLLPFMCTYGVESFFPACATTFSGEELLSPSALNRTFGLSFHTLNNGMCRGVINTNTNGPTAPMTGVAPSTKPLANASGGTMCTSSFHTIAVVVAVAFAWTTWFGFWV